MRILLLILAFLATTLGFLLPTSPNLRYASTTTIPSTPTHSYRRLRVKQFSDVGDGESENNSDEDPVYDEIVPLNVNSMDDVEDGGKEEEVLEKVVEPQAAKVATEEDDIAALLAQAEDAIAGADTVLKNKKIAPEPPTVKPPAIEPQEEETTTTAKVSPTTDPTDLVRKLADGVLDSAGFKREVRRGLGRRGRDVHQS